MTFHFSQYSIADDERVLRRDGSVVTIAPKAIDVLLALLAAEGRVVENAVLMDAVWPDAFVTEANLSQAIYLLRRAFAEHLAFVRIENVRKRGYRIVAPAVPIAPGPTGLRGEKARWLLVAAAVSLALLGSFAAWRAPVAGGALNAAQTRDYLMARRYQFEGSPKLLARGASLYRDLAASAPSSPLAHAGLAETETSLSFYAADEASRSALQAEALVQSREAVALDAASAPALAALGGVQLSIEHDAATAATSFTRALAIDPDEFEALVWYGTILENRGRLAAARELFERAIATVPDARGVAASLAWNDVLAGNYPEAIAYSRQVLAENRQGSVAELILAHAYLEQGDYTAARRAIRSLAIDPAERLEVLALETRMDALRGRRVRATREATAFERTDPRTAGDWDAASIAAAYTSLGDRTHAFLWLSRIRLSERGAFGRDPRFKTLRRDPSFGRWLAA